MPLKNGIPSRLSVTRSANGKIDINNLIPTFQPHKFNNEVYGLSMFVLHGQEDRKEVDNKENRGVELPGTQVVKAGVQELEKKLDRAAPLKHQPKLSTTLQVSNNIGHLRKKIYEQCLASESRKLNTGQHRGQGVGNEARIRRNFKVDPSYQCPKITPKLRSAKLVAKALGPNNTELRKAEPAVNNVRFRH